MRISYWSSDVCSSDLAEQRDNITRGDVAKSGDAVPTPARRLDADGLMPDKVPYASPAVRLFARELGVDLSRVQGSARGGRITKRSEEHTSELQSLMRISYAVFCLKKKKTTTY